jgi:ribosomal protein S14
MNRCDRCGRAVDAQHARYVVRIEVFAATDPLEVDEGVLRQDLAAELTKLEPILVGLSPEEAADGVYRLLRFGLCRKCQIEYLRDPLGSSGR